MENYDLSNSNIRVNARTSVTYDRKSYTATDYP